MSLTNPTFIPDPKHLRSTKRVKSRLAHDNNPTGWSARASAQLQTAQALNTHYNNHNLYTGIRGTETEIVLFLPDIAARVARGKLPELRVHILSHAAEAAIRTPNSPKPSRNDLQYITWLAQVLRRELIELFNPLVITQGVTADSWVGYRLDHHCGQNSDAAEGHGVFPPRMAYDLLNDAGNYLIIQLLEPRLEAYGRAGSYIPAAPQDVDPERSELSKPLLAIYHAWKALFKRGTLGFAPEVVGLGFDMYGYMIVSWPKFLASDLCPSALRNIEGLDRELATQVFIPHDRVAPQVKGARATGTFLFDCSRASVGNGHKRALALRQGLVEVNEFNEASEPWSLIDVAVFTERAHWFSQTFNAHKLKKRESISQVNRDRARLRKQLRSQGKNEQDIHDHLVAAGLVRPEGGAASPTFRLRFVPTQFVPPDFKDGQRPLWFATDHVEEVFVIRRKGANYFAPGQLMGLKTLRAYTGAQPEMDVLGLITNHFNLTKAYSGEQMAELQTGELLKQASMFVRLKPFISAELKKTELDIQGNADASDNMTINVDGLSDRLFDDAMDTMDLATIEEELIAKTLDVQEPSGYRLSQLREATGRRVARSSEYKGGSPQRWFPQLLLDGTDNLEKLADLCIQQKAILPYRDKDNPEKLGMYTFYSEAALRIIKEYAAGNVVERVPGRDTVWQILKLQAPEPAPYIYAWASFCLKAISQPQVYLKPDKVVGENAWTPKQDSMLMQHYRRYPKMTPAEMERLSQATGKSWDRIQARVRVLSALMRRLVAKNRLHLFEIGNFYMYQGKPEIFEAHLIRITTMIGLYLESERQGTFIGKSTPYLRTLSAVPAERIKLKLALTPTYKDKFYLDAMYDHSLLY